MSEPKVFIDIALSYANGEMDFYSVEERQYHVIAEDYRGRILELKPDDTTVITLQVERDKLNYCRTTRRIVKDDGKPS